MDCKNREFSNPDIANTGMKQGSSRRKFKELQRHGDGVVG